jgi:hypothetical protein
MAGRAGIARALRALRSALHGMAAHGHAAAARRARTSLEHLFLWALFGDMQGLPVPPNPYALLLLPHVAGEVGAWKRRSARERDFTDLLS